MLRSASLTRVRGRDLSDPENTSPQGVHKSVEIVMANLKMINPLLETITYSLTFQ